MNNLFESIKHGLNEAIEHEKNDSEVDKKSTTPKDKDYTKIGDYNVADYKETPHVHLDEFEMRKVNSNE